MKKIITAESVTEGHPDKLCDLISDSILDAYLQKDGNSRVAIETMASKDLIVIAGQITSNVEIEIEPIVRNTIKQIGYNNKETDIDYKTCKIIINITKQSEDIALGVDIGGAGDQGIMYGYACDETKSYMPLVTELAHKLAKELSSVRKNNEIIGLRPDGKVQVTMEYEDEIPKRVDTIILSTQHEENVDITKLKKEIKEKVIYKTIEKELIDDKTKIYINPTGKFVIGGPLGDTGLTGRKIIVDTYGGIAHHGGGAFSGKDGTKVDRSASYMLRHIAKNVVANGYAKKCELQISYAIGIAEPISINIDTFGTNTIPEEDIIEKINNTFDLTPKGIIEYLNLQEPIFTKTTNYGHFGKDDLLWEKIISF